MQYTITKISAILIIITMFTIHSTLATSSQPSTLYIVVTFPYLYDDVKNLVCPNDVVVNLIKSGIDPHEYQLTPEDINMIKNADIIISTAHTHFELKIRELIERGELNATLIEIPYLNNIKIFKNPSTNIENYHEILFYPENYITFIDYLKNTLISLNPQCSKNYEENAHQLILRLKRISNMSVKLNKIAILDLPIIQYIAVWLGLNISYILVSEEEVPVTPRDIEKVESILKNYDNSIVVITNSSKASYYLIDLANRYGREYVVLPNPLLSSSIISTLEDITRCLNTSNSANTYVQSRLNSTYIIMLIIFATAAIIVLLLFKLGR